MLPVHQIIPLRRTHAASHISDRILWTGQASAPNDNSGAPNPRRVPLAGPHAAPAGAALLSRSAPVIQQRSLSVSREVLLSFYTYKALLC